MNIIMVCLFLLVLLVVVIYDYFEITAMKYGILRAMATQSKEVDQALKEILKTKQNYKILNKDFKRIERVYLTNLNFYIFKFRDADGRSIRREILNKENFEL